MGQEERNIILFTEDGNGRIVKRTVTEEEAGLIFWHEGDREWDQIHAALPRPVWEKLYDEGGALVYEGYTLSHKAFGAGRSYDGDGAVCAEGLFGIKGLLSGRAYYPCGAIRFEGLFRLNQAYGPNYPEYGAWYGPDGKLLYRGKFGVTRSNIGYPRVYAPEGFGRIPESGLKRGMLFMWEDARKLMN